jgi:ligand-binding sensor domain-containing protein
VFQEKLFIGTQTMGLVAFDGELFESSLWTDRKAQAITTMLVDDGRLVIGTLAGGLIESDGSRFRELKTEKETVRIPSIVCLYKEGTQLFVGTFADGLWLREAGRWTHFNVADGLPSNRIVGVARVGDNIFVASDFGVAMTSAKDLSAVVPSTTQKRFMLVATSPSLSSLTEFGHNVLFCKDNGDSFLLTTAESSAGRTQLRNITWKRPEGLSECRLAVVDNALWLLSSDGIRRVDQGHGESISFGGLAEQADGGRDARGPSNLISALEVDDAGRIWAGSFRSGIDILTSSGIRVAHLESDTIREINFLSEDRPTRTIIAATSQGIVTFDSKLRSRPLTKADGLASNSVLHFASLRETDNRGAATDNSDASPLVLATSKGLSIGEPGKFKSLTTVQGLPSNSVYAVLPFRRDIYVGTLNGLAVVQNGRVVRTINDTNSNLTNNWITALAASGDRLFIGTYGGGVFELMPSGELRSFSVEIGKAVVNPNAIATDGDRLYVGTLDGARVLDLHSQKWQHLRDELPSRVVMSIATRNGNVYFGTTSGIARISASYWKHIEREP